MASTGVLALVQWWGVRGMYETPAIEHKACTTTIGDGPPCAAEHPAIVCCLCFRARLLP
jgi:hypothetical protein